MADLGYVSQKSSTRALMEKYDIRAQKRYGQNFLTDEKILEKIVDAADVKKDDLVLEIGPGTGALTRKLCERAGAVKAVEIDKKLIPVLEDSLGDLDNLEVINSDIMKEDLNSLFKDEEHRFKDRKIVANLPYYITTPVIMKILESHLPVSSVTVMIQKEVADRIKAGPGTKDYGSLSLAVQYHSKPLVVANVPPECFIPRPGVGSVVLKMEIYEDKPVKTENEELMFRLIRGAFNQRRKTLVNAVKNYEGLELDRNEIEKAVIKLGRKANVRGEELSLAEFAKMADFFDNGISLC